VETANDAVRRVAADFAGQRAGSVVESAFLEGGKPDLDGAVQALAARGANEICVLPYFLTLGLHLQRDLPKLVAEAEARHPSVSIRVASPLDGHPRLTDILLARAAEVSS
jgi:sirohydrochlorin ferrochelatase